MIETAHRLEKLLSKGKVYLEQASGDTLAAKVNPEKWSKKEILGHLIDSAINNVQRFTEIQFSPKPFKISGYNQNELVVSNHYQEAQVTELLALWLALNTRIAEIMKRQTPTTLAYPTESATGEISDLRLLMTHYVDHLEHHLNQIVS